ncbi:uncharacterized protein METZ01_LOCUS480173, partial [marine metagenome]
MEKSTQYYYPIIRRGEIQMNVRSFKEFRELGEPDVLFAEQIYLNDDVKIVRGKIVQTNKHDATKKKMVKDLMGRLEAILRHHDFSISFSGEGMKKFMKDRDNMKSISSKIHTLTLSWKEQEELYDKYFRKWKKKVGVKEGTYKQYEEHIQKKLNERNTEVFDTSRYMDKSKWFVEMNGIEATGSLNRGESERKKKGTATSFFSDGEL